jgi:transcriptional regulator PpsR
VDDRPVAAPDLKALSQLAPQLASTFASISSDIALVIDDQGVIRNVAVGASALTSAPDDWVGMAWVDTVTGDTRKKIEQLLLEVDQTGVARRREVNHPDVSGPDIPVAYTALRLGEHGPVLAVGRDLRAIAAIQQRFTESQHEMERGYWKLRQNESRYRRLFQVATDAVLVVDALTLLIVEANHAAGQLFDMAPELLAGQLATIGLDASSRPAVDELLLSTRATGRTAELRARLGKGAMVDVSATPFRGEGTMLLLVRARAAEARPSATEGQAKLIGFVERMPDAVVITDSSGRVLMANPAFVEMCALSSEGQVKGCLLGEWLGGARHELPVLIARAKRQGIVAWAGVSMRPASGESMEVAVSAAMLSEADQECIGFTIRRLGPHAAAETAANDELAVIVERLAAQIGHVALPDLLREAGDIAEHHLLTRAIARAGGERGGAAELLGITRASLDQRLRRLAHLSTERGGGRPASLLN